MVRRQVGKKMCERRKRCAADRSIRSPVAILVRVHGRFPEGSSRGVPRGRGGGVLPQRAPRVDGHLELALLSTALVQDVVPATDLRKAKEQGVQGHGGSPHLDRGRLLERAYTHKKNEHPRKDTE